MEMPIRVLVAKPGLDGHDRGAKVIAQSLRDAGMEVVYTGLRKNIEQIVEIAIQEDTHVIGLSILSGAHVSLTKKLVNRLEDEGVRNDVLIVVGGIIPEQDVNTLLEIGANGVFPMGSSINEIVNFIQKEAPQYIKAM
ncbi:cobalamin B12-binding domain-containing protein [Anaerobacillus sp. MEB173]|uniref:cobalamin B12-binding domain-containing protein n=1 Tax=Anaerobacillus sp. MEB173 TaxID=3383345 RepID=UPI003F929E07